MDYVTKEAHLYEALFQQRNFDWRNQGNTKSCKVTTIVNTNHFPQNLKKQYRFSLAIVVPQSGNHFYSGDRPFEWPTLSEKTTNESTFDEIYKSISTQTCVLRCTQIFHNLIGWIFIVDILFALQRLFDDFNHFTTFIQCKTDEKVSSSGRTGVVKTQFVPRTISLENYRVHQGVFRSTVKNLAFMCIADDRPILSSVDSMKYAESICKI